MLYMLKDWLILPVCKRDDKLKMKILFKKILFSAHTPEEWTELFGRPQLLLGIFSIVFSTACQVNFAYSYYRKILRVG